jgi:broad specificity phosphatase PhoE
MAERNGTEQARQERAGQQRKREDAKRERDRKERDKRQGEERVRAHDPGGERQSKEESLVQAVAMKREREGEQREKHCVCHGMVVVVLLCCFLQGGMSMTLSLAFSTCFPAG